MDCRECPRRGSCREVCSRVEAELPSIDAGRIPPEKAYSAQQKLREVDVIFERLHVLSPRERCVVYLFYRTDLPVTDIAAALRVSRDTVYSTMHRSIRKVSGAMEDLSGIRRARRKRAA